MRASTQRRVDWLISLAKNRAVRLTGSTDKAMQETEVITMKLLAILAPLPKHLWVNATIPMFETALEAFADEVDAEKSRN